MKLSTRMTIVAATLLFLFMIAGFVFTSDETKMWAQVIWVGIFGSMFLLITVTGTWYAVIVLRKKTLELHTITPDENGNFAVVKDKKRWFNPNLLGVDENAQAWALWQATNNKSLGSPARELFTRPVFKSPETQLKLISGPGESAVIDAVAEEL